MKYSSEEIEKAVEIASSAFWADIAISFPEITSGDFMPASYLRWITECVYAVESWLRFNDDTTTSGSAVDSKE